MRFALAAALLFASCCSPAPACEPLEAGDGPLSPVELSCAELDDDGTPILGDDGRPIAKPDGEACCLGEREGVCLSNECVLAPTIGGA